MIAISTQAIYQGFNPIHDLDSDVAKLYVSVRCGGLYHAIMERTEFALYSWAAEPQKSSMINVYYKAIQLLKLKIDELLKRAKID